MAFSVYARDRRNGREYALPHRYFGYLPTRVDAQVALEWYLETSTASARNTVEVYILEHSTVANMNSVVNGDRELVPA